MQSKWIWKEPDRRRAGWCLHWSPSLAEQSVDLGNTDENIVEHQLNIDQGVKSHIPAFMPASDLAMAWSKTRKADTILFIFGILDFMTQI